MAAAKKQQQKLEKNNDFNAALKKSNAVKLKFQGPNIVVFFIYELIFFY